MTINGTTKSITVQEAVVRKVVQKALNGDVRAVVELARMSPAHFSDAAEEAAAALNEHDTEIIQEALRRRAEEAEE